MKSIEKRPYNTMKIKFHPSLMSKAKGAFYSRKIYSNYLKKLIQEQGISFLVGVAVGINLILLLQMSEDIINKLSETLTGSVIGIAAIMSIIIVGVTIVYIQKKIDRKIKTVIEQQNKTIGDDEG
jgi:type IV secretory pathway VirB2 component (pilin)